MLAAVFAGRPAQHWEDTLLAADVGCVVAHREPPETVLQSAEFAGAADMLVEVEHPTFGEHVRLRPYIGFSRSETVAEPGSLAGQHTDAILERARLLGRGDRGSEREEGRGLMGDTETKSEPVLVNERRGAVQVLRLNRPEARNSLNPELLTAIGLGMVEAESDPEVRAVVLTGTGEKAFCAGMDLRAFAEGGSVGR